MNKDDLSAYLKRWTLIRRIEVEELRNAPVELMVRQTLSIWEVAQTLGLTEPSATEDRSWQILQKRWLETRTEQESRNR